LFKFGIVGASGFVVNLAVFATLTDVLECHYLVAAVGAFIVALNSNYLWNRYWTFSSGENHPGFQTARYFCVSFSTLSINLAVLAVLVGTGMNSTLAQAVAVATAMPFNFIGNRLWTLS
jgi:dolichol-phosphate mannosyltransferase